MFMKSTKNLSRADSSAQNQSRIKERLSCSPLKLPLQNAINRAMGTPRDYTSDKYSQSRIITKSKFKDERDSSTSRILTRNIYKEEPEYFRQKMHTQTSNFLKKYFNSFTNSIQIQLFIQSIMRQYEHLWGTQNSNQIFDDFTYKISQLFGDFVCPRQLAKRTLNDGMIGLILEIFKQIKNQERIRSSNYLTVSKNPKIANLRQSFEEQMTYGQSVDNIKNVVQQFMQTMYQCMQSQIYNKFNVEMRRMVVKYRETERLMKKVNEKINSHADIFQYQSQWMAKKRQYEQIIQSLKKQKEQISRQLYRQKSNYEMEKRQNYKLQQENRKLKQNLQKFQNAVLTKVMEPSNFMDTTMSRRLSSNGPMNEKQNIIPQNQQPFKITIDTHIIQKEGELPETKTYATIHNMNSIFNNQPMQASTIKNAESRVVETSPYGGYSPYNNSYNCSSPINLISRRL